MEVCYYLAFAGKNTVACNNNGDRVDDLFSAWTRELANA
jgi:hypothetical protein